MNGWRMGAASLALVVAPFVGALAQEGPPDAAQRENVEYYTAVFWDFKPGKERAALEFAQKHFVPVTPEVGQEPEIAFLSLTGEWDVVVYFPLPEGPEGYAWDPSPSGATWLAKLAEREGGWPQAVKLFEEYDAMVARSKSELVMRSTGP